MASKLSELISATTEKTTPVDADKFPLLDSAATNYFRWIGWSALKTALAGLFVKSDTTGITGANRVMNIVTLTQAEYDALTPKVSSTLYFIVG